MKTKALPFGSTFERKFKIGDLVYWITWEEKENFNIDTIVHRGVLVDIVHQKFGDREVSMAKVLPYGSQETILINITLIRKQLINTKRSKNHETDSTNT